MTSGADDVGGEKPRRVLIVHNWHRGLSGENNWVETDANLLRDAGHEVEFYSRRNEEIDDFGPVRWAGMALRPTISPGDARGLRRMIRSFHPDVVHLHNPLPLISPWVVRTARAAGVPVVQTVHNYLHVCVAGTYFRDGRICHDCAGRAIPWPAVVHGCLEGTRLPGPAGSRILAAAWGLSLTAHRSTWRLVDHFVADGHTVARHLEQMGINPRRVSVRGPAVADPGPPSPPGEDALFVGRLRVEKGAHVMLDAWNRSGLGSDHRLRVVGGGPDEEAIRRTAATIPGVELIGEVSHQAALDHMVGSAFVVVPSIWEEPGATVAVEAIARGRPVVVTTLGELPYIVDPDSGWVVEPTAEGLAAGMRQAFASPLGDMSTGARRRYTERYSPAVSLRTLMSVYAEVMQPDPTLG